MNFNESKHNYKSSIEESIRFAGKDLDFFVEVKADFLRRIAKKFLPAIQKPRILDIGCGHGFIHPSLQNQGFDIVGVEMATEVLDLAKETNPAVSYVGYNGEHLPFQSSSFDIAIAICVMHHVPPSQWQKFLKEMQRVVKKGGVAVIFEHNPYNPLTRYVVSKNELDNDAVLIKSSTLKKLMLQSGFFKAKSHYILFTPFAQRIFRWLDKILWWCPLGAQYYTVATTQGN